MDFSKVSEINVRLSTDYANDQATIKLEPGYLPWRFLDEVSIELNAEPFLRYLESRGIEFSGSLFDGLVMEIQETDAYTQVLLVAPSAILTRNEVTQSFEEETTIGDIVAEIAPNFTLSIDESRYTLETYFDDSSAGKTVMEFLEEIADSIGKKVYVKGTTIYMADTLPEDELGATITLDPKWVSKDKSKKIGGTEAYTKVIARAFVADYDDVMEKEEVLIADANVELVDVVEPDDDVEDEADLQAILDKRVREIQESMTQTKITTPFDPRIKPLCQLIVDGATYIAKEVEHRISRKEWITEVTAYADSI